MTAAATDAARPALIWCPFPNADAAAAAASQLLDEHLIACANIFPGVRSLYRWQGERGEAVECGVQLKTNAVMFEAAIARLAEPHPYETPAILGWRCDASAPATAAWLETLGQ